MKRKCVNKSITSSRQKHNHNSNVSFKNDKLLINRNIKCDAGVKTFQKQSNIPGNALQLDLPNKGLNFGHWNIQGICGKDMSKFSEIKAILTVSKNIHILGLSETKLKEHKLTSMFNVEGYQTPFRKDNCSNGGGGIMVYVRNDINAKRREDLEINNISCIWLEISQDKGKSFLIGNMYRPPDSRVEYNDRFEDFIENVSKEGKEIILLGDFNKNLLEENLDREWQNLTLSLGLTQMISRPTRVTPNSQTLIDHIYASTEENISCVSVKELTVSDHYAIFGNRKINSFVHKHSHKTITYRSFKHFDESVFIDELRQIPWEILDTFDDVNECVQVWNMLFLEIVNKHVPLKQHRVRKDHQPDWLTPEIIDTIKER
ncbi:MAG: endonuclease/exonuclease/phosphatase family protein, partial [Candidatus Thiodiazotropha sp.]